MTDCGFMPKWRQSRSNLILQHVLRENWTRAGRGPPPRLPPHTACILQHQQSSGSNQQETEKSPSFSPTLLKLGFFFNSSLDSFQHEPLNSDFFHYHRKFIPSSREHRHGGPKASSLRYCCEACLTEQPSPRCLSEMHPEGRLLTRKLDPHSGWHFLSLAYLVMASVQKALLSIQDSVSQNAKGSFGSPWNLSCFTVAL